jgi:hypothetical protein
MQLRVVAYPGDFVFDAVWPSFYCSTVADGKNAWLLGQVFFIAVYFVGAVMMSNVVWRALNCIPVVTYEGTRPQGANRRTLGERRRLKARSAESVGIYAIGLSGQTGRRSRGKPIWG